MTLRELLQSLEERNIAIGLKDNRLFVGAAAKDVPPELLQQLQQRRDELEAHFRGHATRSSESHIPAIDRNEPMQLSFSQRGLWLVGQFSGSSGAEYHITSVLNLSGVLDVDLLASALLQIVQRHEVLRTTYASENGAVWQQAHEVDAFELPVSDVTPASLDVLIRAEVEKPFALDAELPIRVRLLRVAAEHHVLVLVIHHIASDGWSNAILVRECCEAYAALAGGRAPALAPLPIQYADYAHWQHQAPQQARYDQQLLYWQEQLAGIPDVHSLPLDRPRPARQSFSGALHRSTLDAALSERLITTCRQHGATLFMGLHAAFSALLSRYSGAADIVVGTPAANREQPEIANLIGFFVNTLVLRATLDEGTTFAGLLAACRQTSLAALSNQQLPFDRLVEALRPARSLSYSPLFQVMLSLNNNEQESITLSGLSVAPLEMSHHTAQFDLTLDVEERDGGLALSWEYSTDLFDCATIARMADSLGCLLEAALTDSDAPLAGLPLVNSTEAARLLVAGRGTQLPADVRCLHETFEAVVARQPEDIALVDGDEVLSYRELNRRANRVAHGLRRTGVGLGDRVALHLTKSHRVAVAMLGVLKAGAAYVPLEPRLPQERAAHYLSDSAPLAVLSEQGCAEYGVPDARWLTIDALLGDDTLPDDNPAIPGLAAHVPAYIVYTSGSTGLPKGVIVEHTAMQHRIAGWSACFGFAEEAPIVLQMAGLGVDICLGDLLKALCHGGRLVLCPHDTLLDAAALHALLEESGTTFGDFVPAVLRELIAEVKRSGYQLAHLKHVLVGSESWHGADLVALQSILSPRGRCYNVYGQTESVIDVCCLDLTKAQVPPQQVVPLGAPLGNTQLLVLSSGGQVQPVGVPGELYIGGPGLARGYVNRPELTARAFLSMPGQKGLLYRTGDYASWRADGSLAFLGRLDAQVKVRGFRIELGEIEAALLRLMGVRQAAVNVHEAHPGDRRLVAYVAADAAGWDAQQARADLRVALPEYMVPAALVRLDALPLNASGKLDRLALPAVDVRDLRIHVPPYGPVEETIAQVWCEVLKLERVGRDDHFFELGGHSMLLVQMTQKLRQKGLQVDLRAVYGAATLADLAVLAVRADSAPATPSESAIPANCTRITKDMLPLSTLGEHEIALLEAAVEGGAPAIEDIYPLSPLQAGILFHHTLQNEGDAYLLRTVFAFDERNQLDRFVESMQTVIDRHAILRTSFHWAGLDQPHQVVHRKAVLPVEELPAVTNEDALAHLLEVSDPRRVQLDVTKAPLLMLYVLPDPRQQRWLMAMLDHHLISDNYTLQLITNEIEALMLDRPSELKPTWPYRQLVAQSLSHDKLLSEQYFRSRLADIETATAPYGLLDVRGNGRAVIEQQVSLSSELADELRRVAHQWSLSVAVLFHVAWALVVARTSGRKHAVFGTVLSGRQQGAQGIENAMGLFINTLPIRINLNHGSVAEVVARTGADLAELLAHENASIALAQSCSGIELGAPLFTTLLNYRHVSLMDGERDAAKTALWKGIKAIYSEERSNYPLGLSINDDGHGFLLTLQCHHDVDCARVLGYLQASLGKLCEALKEGGQSECSTIDILPLDERQRILAASRGPVLHYSSMCRVDELFTRQAKLTPDALALNTGIRQMSYRELDAETTAWAEALSKRGLGSGKLAAVFLERGINMVVAMLAVLKTGAAFVPIDSRYPIQRVVDMLDDSVPALLLTEAGLAAHVENLAIPVVTMCTSPPPLDAALIKLDNAPTDESGHALAYVIFTSGSTGRPKGVMIEHHSLCNLVMAQARAFDVNVDSRVLQFASSSFDACISEVFVTLCVGASLHLVAPRSVLAGQTLIDAVRDMRISHATLPPAVLSALDDPTVLDSLHTLVIAGEAPPQGLAQRWARHYHLINAYGPTEATVCASVYHCGADEQGLPPIGKPMANVNVYLLDEAGRLAPFGVPAEMYIGGVGVARGYLNREELNAQTFLDDPFVEMPGARMYRTGDIACYRANGNLDYLGRNDEQVKIRGVRIEPGEIAGCLRAHPQVLDAVVVASTSVPGRVQLLAYFCDRPDQPAATPEVLRAHLSAHLPDTWLPAAFVRLEALPLTQNGKVDRKALPVPDDYAYAARTYSAPATPVEELIIRVWSSLLGVARIGRNDNFFHLGGHSLLAIQLVARLHRDGLTCGVAELYANPTPAGMAAVAARSSGRPSALPTPVVVLSQDQRAHIEAGVPGGRDNIAEVLPLTPLQEGILYHSLSADQGDVYLLQTVLAFDNRSRMESYLDALRLLVSRHEALRTAVFWEGLSKPVQVTLREVTLTVEECVYPETVDVETALRERFDPSHMRVDLQRAPLMRAGAAFDMANGRWVLVLLCHHLVLDHTTLEIVLDEVRMIMLGRHRDLPLCSPYSAMVANSLAAMEQEHHDRFFAELLGSLTEPTLPFGLGDIQTHSARLRSANLTLDQERVSRLKEQAHAVGVSAASLCHLAWARVLATAANQSDVVFGVVLFGRSHVGAARTVGLMVNTLPFRLQLDGLTVRDAVLATHRLLAALLEHELVSLSRAQRCSGMSAQSALFSSLFNYRYSPEADSGETSLEGVTSLSSAEFSNYPLNADIDDHGTTMSLTVQIAQHLDPEQVLALFDTSLQSLVNALTHNADSLMLALPVVPAKTRMQLLQRGSGEILEVASGGLHGHFETFAAARPDAVALIDGAVALSYGEVNKQADIVATALQKRGVGPGSLVAVFLDRSWKVPVSLLGILKTGAAYVPIEPGTPAQRIKFYLEDAQPVCVLAEEPRLDWAGALPWVAFDDAAADAATPVIAPANFGLAYVVYTSGTTGKPKGVAVYHDAMQHRLRGWQHCLGLLQEPPRVLQMAGLAVDICFGDMLKSLCSGGQLVICPKDALLNPAVLYALLQESRATFGDFVPAVLRELVAYVGERGLRLDFLRHILVGSESWYGADLSALQSVIVPQTKCYNVYGQTESIIDVSLCDVTSLVLAPTKVVPLGNAIPNTQLLVLDRFGQMQPFDVPGELYIGGPGLAAGYLGRAEQTAERFVSMPDLGGALYRTGDFARFNSDGSMDFLGRADQQVKIRGFRIEVSEIEAALLAIDGVTGVAVVPFAGPSSQLLAAHVELLEGSELDQTKLRHELRTQLPEHMVPTCFILYADLPMLGSGKVDRKGLRPVELAAAIDQAPVVTVSERAVAQIWQSLLGLESMPGRQSNFFELGGHSLLGVRFVTQCREQLGVNVAIKDLFVHATVWEMAAWIDVLQQASESADDEGMTVMEW